MIKIMHLANRDTMIGAVEENSDEYIVTHPYLVEIVDDYESGESSGVRMDYLLAFSKDNCVHIKKNVVLYNYNVSDRMEKYYKRLVEYTDTRKNDNILEEVLESIDDMDRKMKALLTQRFTGKSTIN
jgi:hypothetical protein